MTHTGTETLQNFATTEKQKNTDRSKIIMRRGYKESMYTRL